MADLTNINQFPYVIEFGPVEETVSSTPILWVRFSMDMDPNQFTDDLLNKHIILIDILTEESVPVSFVEYNRYSKKLIFKPAVTLNQGSEYLTTILPYGFKNTAGRSLPERYSYSFRVTSPRPLPAPLQTNPPAGSILTESPTFTWSIPSGDVGLYELWLSKTPSFKTTVYRNSSIQYPSCGPLDPTLFEDKTTYYWRVRALDPSGNAGLWSDTISFKFDVSDKPSPDSSVGKLFDDFSVISTVPKNGSVISSLPPVIKITFSSAISPDITGLISIEKSDIDITSSVEYPQYEVGIIGKTLTLTLIDETFENNKRYVISIPDLYELVFATEPKPMYSSVQALRDKFSRFLQSYSDYAIAVQLHRGSVKAIRRLFTHDVSLHELLSIDISPTYDMIGYTESYAAYAILQEYYYSLLEEADRRATLDQFSVAMGSDILEELREALDRLKDEINAYDAADPAVAVKSSNWDPDNLYNDLSLSKLVRRNIF